MLNEAIEEDWYGKVMAVEIAEMSGLLARYLDSTEMEILEVAANVKAPLLGFETCWVGIVVLLIRVMESGTHAP